MILKENTVIVADEQRKGRGRRGRKWISPFGGLWFSMVLRFTTPLISLWAAVAVSMAFEELGYEVKIKWPNDLIYYGKKLGGIVAEHVGDLVILGIGINLKNPIPEEIKDVATGIPEVERDELLHLILSNVVKMDEYNILAEWRKRNITLGKRVCLSSGECGFARDIAEDGALIMMTEKGEIRIYAEDIIQRVD